LLDQGEFQTTFAVLGLPLTVTGAGDVPVLVVLLWFGVTPVGRVGVRIGELGAGAGTGGGAGGTARVAVGAVAGSAVTGVGLAAMPPGILKSSWVCALIAPAGVNAITRYT
jgi:hypothetical protein